MCVCGSVSGVVEVRVDLSMSAMIRRHDIRAARHEITNLIIDRFLLGG